MNEKKLYDEIVTEFKDIKQEPEYGIPDNMTFDDFISDLEEFEIIDLDVMFNEMYSINQNYYFILSIDIFSNSLLYFLTHFQFNNLYKIEYYFSL